MKEKTKLKHKILIKLNDEDKLKATELKNIGLNLTQLFRIMIREKYEKLIGKK